MSASPSVTAELPPIGRVVVLGARGFLAARLATALRRRGTPVEAIGQATVDLTEPGAGEQLADQFRPGDTLVFASALTPDRGRDIRTFMRNVRMGEAVTAALQVRPCRHVVYLSSDAVYGWQSALISEATPPSPPDLYGTMHLVRERMLEPSLSSQKVPLSIVRLCAVYGTGDTHLSYGPNRFLQQALAGEPIALFGDGEETRDHLFVDDAVAILLACIDRPESRLINAVSGRSLSFREVAETVRTLVPTCPGLRYQPRSGPVTHRAFDPTRLLRTFPQHRMTSLAAGLASVVGINQPNGPADAGRGSQT